MGILFNENQIQTYAFNRLMKIETEIIKNLLEKLKDTFIITRCKQANETANNNSCRDVDFFILKHT